MKNKWTQNLIVGSLFFGALSLVGYFTIISDSGPFARPGQQLLAFFPNADGIKIGSRVTILGVPSGRVVGIDLVGVDLAGNPVQENAAERVGQSVALTMELQRPILFYSNYQVSVKNESLLSGKIIAIDPGTSASEDKASRIDVFQVSTRELSDNGVSALEHYFSGRSGAALRGDAVGDPLAALSELIDENRGNLKRTFDNIADITEKINTGKDTPGQLVNNDELHKNANTLVTDAQLVAKELRESLEDTREQAPVTSMIRAALTAF